MSVIAQQESLVKESLFQFITANFPTADLYVIDDIVLSYVISLLEEASGDISFDAEGFIEMMAAYIPEFAQVDSRRVMNWVMELEAKLSNNNAEPDSLSNHGDSVGSNLSINLTLHHLCDATASAPAVKSNRSHSNSESSECSEPRRKELITEEGQWSREWAALSEMFPNSPVMEIKHCVSIAHGDLERAAATLLHRREQGQALSAASMHVSRHQAIDDCELKNRIIARYSYVDKNSDLKEHKPLAPKIEPKKMVRYRDNKIVSLKGERYTEVPKAGAEEENLKKPKRQHCP